MTITAIIMMAIILPLLIICISFFLYQGLREHNLEERNKLDNAKIKK